jgi:hypothetical protein
MESDRMLLLILKVAKLKRASIRTAPRLQRKERRFGPSKRDESPATLSRSPGW